MSTTITVKTHDWPVEVVLTDSFWSPDYRSNGTTVQQVKPHSEQQFCITQNRAASFRELQRPSPDA